MKRYEHLFFDLDHTLWDFSSNCAETLTELYALHQLQRFNINLQDFIVCYRKINDKMWSDFNQGKTNKEVIRSLRFLYTFRSLGLKDSDVPKGIDDQFIEICPTKSHVFPYTHEVLDYLSEKYVLHILTNGFQETQFIKIKSAGLEPYFREIIHSELSGYMKPDKRMFEYALNAAGTTHEKSLMVGDDLYADVLGAKNIGMDHVFVNRTETKHDEILTHEITCLSTLKHIL